MRGGEGGGGEGDGEKEGEVKSGSDDAARLWQLSRLQFCKTHPIELGIFCRNGYVCCIASNPNFQFQKQPAPRPLLPIATRTN